MAHRLANSGARTANQAQKAFAIGLLTGRENVAATEILANAVTASRKLPDIKPFWC
jgi:hypothetical protein